MYAGCTCNYVTCTNWYRRDETPAGSQVIGSNGNAAGHHHCKQGAEHTVTNVAVVSLGLSCELSAIQLSAPGCRVAADLMTSSPAFNGLPQSVLRRSTKLVAASRVDACVALTPTVVEPRGSVAPFGMAWLRLSSIKRFECADALQLFIPSTQSCSRIYNCKILVRILLTQCGPQVNSRD